MRMKDVLEILERDARMTPEQVAAMTGRSVEEVKSIIREAEDNRVLIQYRSMVNWEKAGEPLVYALIEVKVSPQRGVGFDSFAERISRFPEVWAVTLVSGDYDLIVMVKGRSMQEVSNFVSSKLSALEPVLGTNTHFV